MLSRVVLTVSFAIPLSLLTLACSQEGQEGQEGGRAALQSLTPPMAEVVPQELEKHGDVRVDDYYWLRERENPEVIAYLEAENAYTEAVMAHTAELRAKLFEEIKGRIKQTDLSVPFKLDDYFYYTKTEEGKEYPIYARKRGSLEADEEILIDVNAVAEGHGFTSVPRPAMSYDHGIMAFAADTVGRRFYTIRFRDLRSGELLDDDVSGARMKGPATNVSPGACASPARFGRDEKPLSPGPSFPSPRDHPRGRGSKGASSSDSSERERACAPSSPSAWP